MILVAAPLLQIVVMALWPAHAGVGASGLGGALRTPDFWSALQGTLTLAFLTMVFSVGLGGGLASLVVERPLPAQWLWEALLLAPFLLPPYLTGISWSLALQPGGYCSQFVGAACAPLGRALYSLPGMAWVMALHLAPLTYLMLRAALLQRAFTPALAARVHGAGRLRTLILIELPSLAPAIGAAALLTFLAGSEEYGVPAVIGSYAGINVLATSVEGAVSVWPIDLPKAASLGLMLCLLAVLAWLTYRWLATFDGDAPHRQARQSGWSAFLPVFAFVILADVVPIGVIVATSLMRAVTNGLAEANLTWSHYITLFTQGSDGLQAFTNSLWLSLVTAAVTVAAGLIVAAALRRPGSRSRGLDLMATLPTALPGVVVAVGLVLFWNARWNPVTLYGTPLILVVSYMTVTFPYALRYAQIGLAASGGNLNAAGAVHGAGPLRRLVTVTLPLAAPALAGAASVVFALSMRELVTSVMLQPPGTEVVSTYVMNQFLQGDVGDGMAMAVVGVFSSAIMLGLARLAIGRR
ncbi:ABC transporter permease [Solirhodobacter olei]|uniref:ABC transporter permease n=1 Tax=Solirhodobacter olei TaxID=2493082 RepID=UPI0013E2A3E1|nr:ABC transporter permease subunit [Solirhodobacter olei]